MIIKASEVAVNNPILSISLRCPGCLQQGVFWAIPKSSDLVITSETPYVIAGIRRCPNPQCWAVVFFFSNPEGKLLTTYPPESIDLDLTNIPNNVRDAIEEAVKCHAIQCYTAAAIMVRKTLEELCRDRGANGKNLKERIKDLGTKIVLPTELLEGLDDLRLLGNDAAHIESQEFNKIGKDEVEVGIEFAKEILKAVYQYSALLNRLRSLKKTDVNP
ncbi:MAG: DUF4145 domain-containing protein [Acidobacteria bacterium]|nr:DUF4145 domain-containing protein [Acidobacteriota bacterium]